MYVYLYLSIYIYISTYVPSYRKVTVIKIYCIRIYIYTCIFIDHIFNQYYMFVISILYIHTYIHKSMNKTMKMHAEWHDIRIRHIRVRTLTLSNVINL
jgi:hypothetical protein